MNKHTDICTENWDRVGCVISDGDMPSTTVTTQKLSEFVFYI